MLHERPLMRGWIAASAGSNRGARCTLGIGGQGWCSVLLRFGRRRCAGSGETATLLVALNWQPPAQADGVRGADNGDRTQQDTGGCFDFSVRTATSGFGGSTGLASVEATNLAGDDCV